MQQKMGGPFVPLPGEVINLLWQETHACFTTYIYMLNSFFVEHVLDLEGIWVGGRIHASRNEIIRKVSKSRGNFRRNIWPRWEKIGVAEIRDGGVFLPKLYKKADAYIQPLTMQKEIKELKAWQGQVIYDRQKENDKAEEMQNTIKKLLELTHLTGEPAEVITICRASQRPGSGLCEARTGPHRGPAVSLLGSDHRSKISLGDINKHISQFYKAIGQSRISGVVREKACGSWKRLQGEGYKPGEIIFALGWIPKHATEPLKHFGIVAHMIEEALKAGRKEDEKAETQQAAEDQRRQDQENRMSEQQEMEALQIYKDQLPEDERAELKREAVEMVSGMEGIKSDWIAPPLIKVTENDLIRKRGINLADFMPRADNQEEKHQPGGK